MIELFHIQTDQSDGGEENARTNREQQTAAVQFVRQIHKSFNLLQRYISNVDSRAFCKTTLICVVLKATITY